MNDENNQTLIAHTAEDKLGNNLDAFLVGNVRCFLDSCAYAHPRLQEPDLYGSHQKRPSNYSEQDYIAVRLSFLLAEGST